MNWEKEKRRQARLERLGTNNPRCGICGETDERCLEGHHVSKKAFGDATGILCRNCHRKGSDDQRDHPEQIDADPSLLECLGHFLLGAADLLAMLVDECRRFASQIFDSLASKAEVRQ